MPFSILPASFLAGIKIDTECESLLAFPVFLAMQKFVKQSHGSKGAINLLKNASRPAR